MKKDTTKKGIFGVVEDQSIQSAYEVREAYTEILKPVHWTEEVLLAVGDVETIVQNRKTDTKIQALLADRHRYNDQALDCLMDCVDSVTDTTDQAMDIIYTVTR